MGCNQSAQKNDPAYKDELISQFIVDLNHQQTKNGIHTNIDPKALEQPRLVFCSLIGLFNTYKQCPMFRLVPAMFILPLKSSWIEDPLKCKQELSESVIGQISLFLQDAAEFAQFMHLLQWKKQQNLLFCMLDNEEDLRLSNQSKSSLIAPFWTNLSKRLVSMGFNGLDALFSRPSHFESKYGIKYIEVFTELCCLTMRYKSVQEIIYASNADTLDPIVCFSSNMDMAPKVKYVASVNVTEDAIGCDEQHGVWFIADDYFCSDESSSSELAFEAE